MNELSELSVVDYSFPILISKVKHHQEIKQKILNGIKQMGRHSIDDGFHCIHNTDWYLPADNERYYKQYIGHAFVHHNQLVAKLFNSTELSIKNFWFQQYGRGDYHNWHVHPGSMFSNVYYVDLGEGTPKTSLRILDKIVEIPVEEGVIVTFPSFIQHCSKPNKSDYINKISKGSTINN